MEDQHTVTAWSAGQQAYTRQVLEQVDPVAFLFSAAGENQGCYFNHLDGRRAYMRLQDALNYRFYLFEVESNAQLACYNTIDALIAGGWKVST